MKKSGEYFETFKICSSSDLLTKLLAADVFFRMSIASIFGVLKVGKKVQLCKEVGHKDWHEKLTLSRIRTY